MVRKSPDSRAGEFLPSPYVGIVGSCERVGDVVEAPAILRLGHGTRTGPVHQPE